MLGEVYVFRVEFRSKPLYLLSYFFNTLVIFVCILNKIYSKAQVIPKEITFTGPISLNKNGINAIDI